jgi:peroxiredoxin
MKGVSLQALGEFKDAESEFRAAIKLSQELSMAQFNFARLSVAHYNLGVTLMKQGRDAEGIEQLKTFLQLMPPGDSSREKEVRQFIENPRRVREHFAPEFSLVSKQGEYISIDQLRGKVVVLDFWATWCGPCRASLPALRRLHKKFRQDPFVLISISSDNNEEAWQKFVEEEKMEWTQYLDPNRKLNQLFEVRAIPTYFVIDAEGILRRKVVGWGSFQAADLEQQIKESLKALAKKQ